MNDKEPLVAVNKAMKTMLYNYLGDLNKVAAISFDFPDVDAEQFDATISVFLYDIHEDLQLRTAESRGFNAGTGKLSPGWVNVKCNYLITFWESTGKSRDAGHPDNQPDNQAVKVMSKVLAALINNRRLADIPGAYTQVIPPKENLNSLGNFWQSMGNRPRLSLNYCVTVPISLDETDETVAPVKSLSTIVGQKAPVSSEAITDALRKQLIMVLNQDGDGHLAVAHVNLDVSPEGPQEKETNTPEIRVSLRVSGITPEEYFNPMYAVFEQWKKDGAAAVTPDGYRIFINAVDNTDLTGV